MPTLLIRNSDIAPPAALGVALERAGEEVLEVFGPGLPDAPIPEEDRFTHLIALGGLESSRGPEPWIAAQRERMRRWLGEGRAVLGVCLGAQVLADALGWRHLGIGERPEEQGFLPLERTAEGLARDLFPGVEEVFLSHNEGFVVEGEGALLACTRTYHQAFVVGRAMGVQFHPESTVESVAPWFHPGGLPEERRDEIEAKLRSRDHTRQAGELLEAFYRL